jgi:integrase/recombinase XerD
MYQEMQIRNYSPRSIENYISQVASVSCHFGKSPDQVSIAELKEYLFYKVDTKNLSASSVNQTISAFKILFRDVLGRDWDPVKIKRPRRPKPLPVVFSKEEMSLLLDRIINRKHYCLVALTYGSGLRLGEVTGLKFGDIDSDRMQLRVRAGKGNKDRYTLLSMDLLEKLREYYRYYRPKTYLFEGRAAGKAYSKKSVQDLFKKILLESGIKKEATFHTLRHTFATHLLEQGTNIRVIQELLGHRSLRTTSVYLHVTNFDPSKIKSPLDGL